jgi:hypothetical protein
LSRLSDTELPELARERKLFVLTVEIKPPFLFSDVIQGSGLPC